VKTVVQGLPSEPTGLKVNEIFYSIHGEGGLTGRPMAFVRLSGCNLKCTFCDTNHKPFVKLKPKTILKILDDNFKHCHAVCITGGEPLIQDISELVFALKARGLYVALETNGTKKIPTLPFDYISVSPKGYVANGVAEVAHEVKLVVGPETDFTVLRHFQCPVYLQPCNKKFELDWKWVTVCVKKVIENPKFRLSLQLQKVLGIN